MGNISDFIEGYIHKCLQDAAHGVVELQRRELARKFSCVPSQINYVITTRFTPDRGYHVESRRGEGGYIRISRVRISSLAELNRLIGQSMSFRTACDILVRLKSTGSLDENDDALIRHILIRETEDLPAETAGIVRARIIKAMLSLMLRDREV